MTRLSLLRRRLVGTAAAVALVSVAALLWGAGQPVGAVLAQSGSERIVSLNVAIRLDRGGSVDVTETIVYDFGPNVRHGITREIPVRYALSSADYERLTGKPTNGRTFERVTPLHLRDVTTPDGDTPVDAELEHMGAIERIRIGDPDRTIGGRHTYVISYRLEGVVNAIDAAGDSPAHDELYLNVMGAGWLVPAEAVSATVTAPGRIDRVACYSGPAGSTEPCGSLGAAGGTSVSLRSSDVAPGSAVTVVVATKKGVLAEPRPILDEVWSLSRAFALTPATLAGSGGLLAAMVAAVGFLGFRVGRDRRFVGSAVERQFGNASGETEPVPLLGKDPITVEYTPPDGLPPGLVGTLLDEVAHPLDVSATIVDLAVRGYLRIAEVDGQGLFRSADFSLTQLGAPDERLTTYETRLLNHLFASGSTVQLSDLKQHFRAQMGEVQDDMYRAVVSEGWYVRRPDRQRLRWAGIGTVVLLAGAALTVLLAIFTSWALVGLAVVAVGLLLLGGSHRMPSRTAKGTAAYRRILGFREMFLAGEGERQHWVEEKNLFSRYLPYAIVFGCTERWAATFAQLAAEGVVPADDLGWWMSPRPFDWIILSHSLDSFSTAAAGQLAAAAPSSAGGGFSGFDGGGSSGGGFGGGGGGSW